MLDRWASLTMLTSVLETLPGKLDIKRHSPSIVYVAPFRVGRHCVPLCRKVLSAL